MLKSNIPKGYRKKVRNLKRGDRIASTFGVIIDLLSDAKISNCETGKFRVSFVNSVSGRTGSIELYYDDFVNCFNKRRKK